MKAISSISLVSLLSCVHKIPIPEIPKEPVYTREQMEVYLDLQGRCEDLLSIFQTGEFRFSQEPYFEKISLFQEASQLDLWQYCPERLDKCLSLLQEY